MADTVDDHAALLAAIASNPADDLTRLIYADYHEEHGHTEYAHFIREQIRLDPLPPWHPDVIRANFTPTSHSEWTYLLPQPPERIWRWPADPFYKRGLPYSVIVRDLTGFIDYADTLFEHYPIGELQLPTAALSEWQRFAQRPWLSQIKSIIFYGVATPIEPLRVISETDCARSLTAITLQKAGGPAVPILLADLFASPTGRQLDRLELQRGAGAEQGWLEALQDIGPLHHLTNLELHTMGTTPIALSRITNQFLALKLTVLIIKNDPIGFDLEHETTSYTPVTHLQQLQLPACRLNADSASKIIQEVGTQSLKLIDLSYNSLSGFVWPDSAASAPVSMRFQRCGLGPTFIHKLIESRAWDQLVELDLSGNRLSNSEIAALIRAKPPRNLVRLTLSGLATDTGSGQALSDRYGTSLVIK